MIHSYFIIAVSDDEHRFDSIDSTTQELQEIKRSFIRPVNILDDYYGRRASVRQLIESGRKDGSTRRFFFEKCEQVALSLRSYVVQRTERTRRKQRITRAPEHSCLLLVRLGESLDKRCLSDSRFATHENQAPTPCGYIFENSLQVSKELFALKQLHFSDYRSTTTLVWA